MNINIQILSFLFSFLYGIIISLSFILLKKAFYNYKKIYSFFNSFLYTIIHTLVYFKIIYIINGGIVKIHFLLTLGLSAYIFYTKLTKILSK